MVFLYLANPEKVELFSVCVKEGKIEKIDQDKFPGMSLKVFGLAANPDPGIRRHLIRVKGFELMMIDTSEITTKRKGKTK